MIGAELTAARTFSAAAPMFSGGQFASTMPNRSPPSRPMMSLTRRQLSSRRPISISTDIGRFIAEHVVDHRHVVDADRQKRGGAFRALVRGDDLVDRLAQPALVEMTGQFVVIGQPFEPRLLDFAVADRADEAEHGLRPAGGVALGAAALMHPDKTPAGVAQPVFAVERGLAFKMRGKRQLAMHQIIGMDAGGEAAAGRQFRRRSRCRPRSVRRTSRAGRFRVPRNRQHRRPLRSRRIVGAKARCSLSGHPR